MNSIQQDSDIIKAVESLKSNVSICDKHMARMEEAFTYTQKLFPINIAILEGLYGPDLAMLDLLITRFAKLQDTIGRKIFPLIYELRLGENPEDKSYIDIMNSMEKIGALESTDIWNNFRRIRNSITHDYPDQSKTCEQLNLCRGASLDLIAYWQYLRKFIDDKVLVLYKIETS